MERVNELENFENNTGSNTVVVENEAYHALASVGDEVDENQPKHDNYNYDQIVNMKEYLIEEMR
jgi:hypothetical protein